MKNLFIPKTLQVVIATTVADCCGFRAKATGKMAKHNKSLKHRTFGAG